MVIFPLIWRVYSCQSLHLIGPLKRKALFYMIGISVIQQEFFYILGNHNIQNIYCASVFSGFRLNKFLPFIYKTFKEWAFLSLPFLTIVVCAVDTAPHHVFSQTFRIKWFLAKKQKQNHPTPPMISLPQSSHSLSPMRGDTGKEWSRVYKELYMRCHMRIIHEIPFCIKATNVLPYHAENTTTIRATGHALLGNWFFSYFYVSVLVDWFTNNYVKLWGAWVAQSSEQPTLGFTQVLWVMGSSPMMGSTFRGESAWKLSPSVPPPTHTHIHSPSHSL